MIRNALPTDAKAIAQVHVSSWQEAYRELMPAEYLNALDATLARGGVTLAEVRYRLPLNGLS